MLLISNRTVFIKIICSLLELLRNLSKSALDKFVKNLMFSEICFKINATKSTMWN